MKSKNVMGYFLIFILLLLAIGSFVIHFTYKYTVRFDSYGGNKIKSIEVGNGKKIGKLEIPVKDGYEFLYWAVEGEKVDENYKVTSNVTLVAYYKGKENSKPEEKPEEIPEEIPEEKPEENVKTYKVTFDTDGGSKIAAKEVKENKVVSKPTNPTKDGYLFKEWQLDGKAYDFSAKVTKDITLKAIYVKDTRKTYIVTFDTDGGSKISTQSVKEGDTAKKPSNPTKSGYTFKEWQLNGKAYNFNTKVTSNVTLKAVYTKVVPKVSVTSVTLDKYSYSLNVGQKVTLKATVKPDNATNKTVSWSSSDKTKATVSNGVVTALKAGTVTITATADGKTAKSTITITEVLTYTYEIKDVPGSTTGQCYIYIKSSAGKYVAGSATVVYQNGASETIDIPASGYMWPSRSVISSIKNVKAK